MDRPAIGFISRRLLTRTARAWSRMVTAWPPITLKVRRASRCATCGRSAFPRQPVQSSTERPRCHRRFASRSAARPCRDSKPPSCQSRPLDSHIVPENLLPIDNALRRLFERAHQRQGDRSAPGRREPDSQRPPAQVSDREIHRVTTRLLRLQRPSSCARSSRFPR